MYPPTTGIVTTRHTPSSPRRDPNDVLAAQVLSLVAATEWRMVRNGLGLMAGSLTTFLICLLGAIPIGRYGPDSVLPLFLLGFLFSGAGFVAGVFLTLIVPRRAESGGWISTQVVALIAGVVLLVAAGQWRVMSREIAGVTWKPGTRVLAWSAVASLLISHLGYCLHLRGIARRFGARSLARWCVALFLVLALPVGPIALTDAACVYGWPPWISLVWVSRLVKLMDWYGGLLLALVMAWTVLLWRMWRLVPRLETGAEPDEE